MDKVWLLNLYNDDMLRRRGEGESWEGEEQTTSPALVSETDMDVSTWNSNVVMSLSGAGNWMKKLKAE